MFQLIGTNSYLYYLENKLYADPEGCFLIANKEKEGKVEFGKQKQTLLSCMFKCT